MKNIISAAVAAAMLTSGLPVFAQPTLEDQKHESGVLLDGSGAARSASLLEYVNSSASAETLEAIGATKEIETKPSPAVARAKAELAVSPDGATPPEVEKQNADSDGALETGIFKLYNDTVKPPAGGSRLAKLARAVLAPVVVPLISMVNGAFMGYALGQMANDSGQHPFAAYEASFVGMVAFGAAGAAIGIVQTPIAIAKNIWGAITGK